MIIVEKTIISDDIAEKVFVCDVKRCQGACCVEGDLGAPLEEVELSQLEEIYPVVKPYLSEAGQKAVKEQGVWVLDEEGDFSTPTVEGRECAYAIYDRKGILKCGIEQAYRDGKITFQKPISCHLYPIRVTRYEEFDALNYDVWDICAPACELGAALNVPIYQFLKEPLIRKYGADWYAKLVAQMEQVPTTDDTGAAT